MVAMAMARDQLNQDITAMHLAMTTEFRDSMAIMVVMVAMAMVRGLLSQDIMAMHLAMTIEFRDSMATTDMARDLLSPDMVDIMDMPMSMKTPPPWCSWW